jgi:putative aldouronate transport system permease protein
MLRMKTLWKSYQKNKFLLVLTLPMVIYVFIIKYLPMLGVIVAFKRYRFDQGILGSEWIGLKNFKFLLDSPDLWRLVRNTLGYNISFIITGLVGSVIAAVLLYEMSSRKALKLYQTIMIFPHFLSWVIVAFMLYAFLNPVSGMLNQLFSTLGLESWDWYNKAKPWILIFPLSHLWKEIGMSSIIYYAALMGINPEFFEAAKMDGAGRWKIITRIKLPFLYPIISILTILAIGNLFDADFGLFYQLPMNSPTILSTTDVLDTFIFRALMEWGDIGMSSAAGLVKSIVGFILVVLANAYVRKVNSDNSLF